jgi:uncharacterized protein YjbJ (UPF0337 family)
VDKEKIEAETNQADQEDAALIDKVEERVEAEMKLVEGRAKESVGQGMHDEKLEQEGRKLKEEGEREIEDQLQNK